MLTTTDDDARTPARLLYYKLTLWAFGSGELKSKTWKPIIHSTEACHSLSLLFQHFQRNTKLQECINYHMCLNTFSDWLIGSVYNLCIFQKILYFLITEITRATSFKTEISWGLTSHQQLSTSVYSLIRHTGEAQDWTCDPWFTRRVA